MLTWRLPQLPQDPITARVFLPLTTTVCPTMLSRLTAYSRSLWDHTRHFVYHHVLHADDPPHRLALGVAIGMFVTFTPTVGVQMALTLSLAWLLGANKIVGLPLVWISNPATLVPIYYGVYLVGCACMGTSSIGWEWWQQLSSPPPGWWPTVQFFWSKLIEVLAPLTVGGVIVGLATAIPSYYATYFAVRAYRLKRWGQLTPPPAEITVIDEMPAAEELVVEQEMMGTAEVIRKPEMVGAEDQPAF